MSREQALKDLKAQIRLEKELRPKLRNYFSDILREYKASQLNSGTRFSLNDKELDLEEILNEHSEKVVDRFSDSFDHMLDEETELTLEEKTGMALLLGMFIREQSKKAARQITTTTAKNIIQAESIADGLLAQSLIDGESVGRVDRVLNTTAILAKKFKSRIKTIATSETQLIVETTKNTIASTIAREAPYIQGLQKRESKVKKTWWTVGDERVRTAHVKVHGQTVPTNEPFIVMDQSLMFPRDTNLGATAENVINCRCKVTYNEDDLISARKAEGL